MSDRLKAVMDLCCQLFADEEIRKTGRGSVKGAAMTGGAALLGALILGPVGLVIGGAGGGLISYLMTKDQFKPLPQVIMELTPPQKKKLYDCLMDVLKNLQWRDLPELTALVTQHSLKLALKQALFAFLKNEPQISI